MIYFPCSPPHGTHLRPFPEVIVPLWLRNFILDQYPPSAWPPPSSISRNSILDQSPPPHGHPPSSISRNFILDQYPPSAWPPPSSISRNFILDQHPIFPLAKLLHFFDIRKPAHIFWCIFPPHGAHLRPFPEISFWVKITKSSFFPPKYLHISNICSTFALAFSYQLPIRPIGFPYHSHRIPIG